MAGKNIGDLLNAANITWGGFMGGFNLSIDEPQRHDRLRTRTTSTYHRRERDRLHSASRLVPVLRVDRQPDPCPSDLGRGDRPYQRSRHAQTLDPANHEYDINDFYAAVQAGNFPAVSYLKAPAFQDGHAGYSDPADEQTFIVKRGQLPAAAARLEGHRRHRHL